MLAMMLNDSQTAHLGGSGNGGFGGPGIGGLGGTETVRIQLPGGQYRYDDLGYPIGHPQHPDNRKQSGQIRPPVKTPIIWN